MRYLSVCSGIEAATCAWHPLGWTPVGFSEIEPFPAAVLAHHYPNVPNFGDMTRFQEWPDDLAPDLIVGGTPCQSFSVAGLRKGLADPRGNLALVYLALADRYRPEWLVWENVPGVLSSNGGRDFGAFLGGLVQLGYGFAYRVLDAQYFGVAQRRRRVFVVANARDWRRAAAVLFERHSLSGHPAPRRETGKGITGGTSRRPDSGHVVNSLTANNGQRNEVSDVVNGSVIPVWPAEVASTLNAAFGSKQGLEDQHALSGASLFVPATAHTLRGEGFDASEGGTGRGTPLVPVAFDTYNQTVTGDTTQTLCSRGDSPGGNAHLIPAIAFSTLRSMGHDGSHANGGGQVAVAFAQNQRDEVRVMDVAGALAAEPGAKQQTYIAFSCKDHGADASEIAPTLRSMGHDGSHANGGGQVAVAFGGQMSVPQVDFDLSQTLQAKNPQAVAIGVDGYNGALTGDVAATMGTRGSSETASGPQVMQHMAVRRLTPRECERLQGFPDDYTDIRPKGKDTPDGPRYKALGNSMAVPVMAWIGRRIAQVAGQDQQEKAT